MALAAHPDAEASAAELRAESLALALWERAVGLDRWRRDDALLASPDGSGHVPEGLGARNAALLAVRNALFDAHWPLRSRCPDCGEAVEFAADSLALAAALDEMRTRATPPAAHGGPVRLRAPTARDLSAVAHHPDRRAAALALLARCADGLGPAAIGPAEVDGAGLDELGRRLEALDPAAIVSFALACPNCAHRWSAAVDVGEAVWSELRLLAERTLTDVDALARAYGWTEDEVLRLSPARRAAYLQLVGAA